MYVEILQNLLSKGSQRAEQSVSDSSYPVRADKMAEPRAIGSGSTMPSGVGTIRIYNVPCSVMPIVASVHHRENGRC